MDSSGCKIFNAKIEHSQMINFTKTLANASKTYLKIKYFDGLNVLKNNKEILASYGNRSDISNEPLAKIQICHANFSL